MKRCGHCKRIRSDFFVDNNRPSKLSSWCKACISDRSKLDYPKKKENQRGSYFKRAYGISVSQYNDLYNKQKGRCAICFIHQSELSRRLAVDHNHLTGRVRSLLCPKCNWKVGFVETTELVLIQKYIDNHEVAHV
jgi:hypothetical protein